MKLQFIANIYMLFCSTIALGYGLSKILSRKKAAAYFTFSVFAVLCVVLSRLYYSVSVICFDEVPQIFNLGFLGYFAMFMFIFFSNYGQIDKLVDDRKSLKPVYRIIPAIIPVIELFFGITAVLYGTADISVCISFLIMTVLAGWAGYFNIKHIIVPDVDFGIAKSIRGYNFTALLIEILSLVEVGLSCFDIIEPIIWVEAVLGILYLAVLPILYKGVKKWIQ